MKNVALITGASSGIGHDASRMLLSNGGKVLATGRRENGCKDLIEEFGAGTASFTIYLIPVAGVITGVLVLDEALTTNMVVALLLIVAGVFVINRDQPS